MCPPIQTNGWYLSTISLAIKLPKWCPFLGLSGLSILLINSILSCSNPLNKDSKMESTAKTHLPLSEMETKSSKKKGTGPS